MSVSFSAAVRTLLARLARYPESRAFITVLPDKRGDVSGAIAGSRGVGVVRAADACSTCDGHRNISVLLKQHRDACPRLGISRESSKQRPHCSREINSLPWESDVSHT